MNAYGSPRLPQRPSPDSRAVGMALSQQGAAMPMMPMMEEEADPSESVGSNALRRQGAMHMGSPGQHTEGDPALSHAIGEALTRVGSGYQTNPNRAGKQTDRAYADLIRLGLSETEAELLLETGGF